MSLLTTMGLAGDAMYLAALGAFRAADSVKAATPMLRDVAVGQTVGYNAVERAAAVTYLAAFTRLDQTIGMNSVDRALSDVYAKIFSSTPGLRLPGYGVMEDLITLAPFLRRRGR